MTPELRHKIAAIKVLHSKMLAKDDAALQEEIEKEVEENLGLEQGDEGMQDEVMTISDDDANEHEENGNGGNEHIDEERDPDTTRDDDMGDNSDDSPDELPGGEYNSGDWNYMRNPAPENTLYEDLLRQVGESKLSNKEQMIASHIVGNLDDNGFFTMDPYELADYITFKEGESTDEDEVLDVLKTVQAMEPAGIAARNLQECMLLQLAQRHTSYTPMATRLIQEHWDLFQGNRIDRIAKAMDITVHDVNDLYEKELNHVASIPGRGFNTTVTNEQHITPTFIISVDGNDVNVEIPNNFPELHIAESYKEVLRKFDNSGRVLSKDEAEARAYIAKGINNADIFIKALEMRQQTLAVTMAAIIKLQHDYFLSGGNVFMLKPMKLEDLESVAGRDVSTLSRATSEKYMLTDWGTVALRELFSEGLNKRLPDGTITKASTMEVKQVLATLIRNEDKTKPLSDEKLAGKLNEMGYDIARRTVVKYREIMKIPNTAMRKQHI